MTKVLDEKENELINELYATANECDELARLIENNTLPSNELKAKYKELKNRCKARYNEINYTIRPIAKTNVLRQYVRNYAEAVAYGFREPTNGNLRRMIISLEEASYKFKKFLNLCD